ncbi:hypothetical protein ACIQYF_09670 [Pseudomonas sp. NPDC096917]|uniref:hypothetical protein n=1 Tax=Pseudomonas sp. NPDC096917 TaxID=3364483 RepID=UPI00383BA234
MPKPKPLIKPSGPKVKAATAAIKTIQKVVTTSTNRKKSTASKSLEFFKIKLVDNRVRIKPMITPDKLNTVSA